MRGSDGRLWPWGNVENPNGANWARVDDGHEVSASVGTIQTDKSPYGVMDGAGNVMEWVEDWYGERYFEKAPEKNPPSPDHGVFRVLRGGGYATSGADIRITSRSKMVPDFRDETIGFRCAKSVAELENGWRESARILEEIKVIEDEKHRQNNIDNHADQNYNIEHFWVSFHRVSPDFSCAARNFE